MNEVTYSYYQHQKEMKNIARSAKRKVVNRKPGRVMMPSDYLSRKEKRELNGTMVTYEMDKPHNIRELQAWPESYQKEYIETIVEKYQPKSMQLMQDLLHTSWKPFVAYMERLGISEKGQNRKHRTAAQKEAWRKFIEGQEPEPKAEPMPEPEKKKVEETKVALAYPDTVNIRTLGKPLMIFNTIAQYYCDPDKEYEISVVAVKKKNVEPAEPAEEYTDSIPEDEF